MISDDEKLQEMMVNLANDMLRANGMDRKPKKPKANTLTHDIWTDCAGVTYYVHRWQTSCRNGCAIHAPSPHHMHLEDWPQLMRETMLIERICEHGIGHPDPDSVAFYEKKYKDPSFSVHGCDGCCVDIGTGKHRKTKEN